MTIAYRAKGNIYLNITNRCSSDCTFCLAKFTDSFPWLQPEAGKRAVGG